MRILMLNEFKNKYVNTENSFSFILSQPMFFIIIQLKVYLMIILIIGLDYYCKIK